MIIFIEKVVLFGYCMLGFRKGYLIIIVLIGIWDDLKCFMNRGEVLLMVFVDYFKVFDIVCFSIVLKKMYCLGFFGLFLKWMINYLLDRRYFV